MNDRVVVVGGGLAGLVAAYELTQRGVACTVLEAADSLGGRVRTIGFGDDAVAEAGMEEIWETSPAYALAQRLGLALVRHPAHSSVVLDGCLHPYRASAGAPAHFAECFGRDIAAFRRWNTTAAEVLALAPPALLRMSFRSYVSTLDLPHRVRTWIRMMVESETAVAWDRLTALDGVAEMAPLLVDANMSPRESNVRIAGGNDQLIKALAAALPDGAVRLGSRVRRVVDSGNAVEIAYEDGHGRHGTERGDHVLLTAPMWALKGIQLEPGLDLASRTAMASIGAAPYVKVVLRLRTATVGLREHAGEHPFTVLTDGPAGCVYLTDGRPDGRDHVVTMLIHGRFARRLTGRPVRDIVARSIAALEQLVAAPRPGDRPVPLLVGVARAITDARVFDHPRAVAYWPYSHGRSRFDALSDALRAPHGRVLIGGDTTDSSHSDGAVRAAQRMADVALRRLAPALAG